MRIERVDEKTVKCYLTNEELAEFEVTYKDFVTRSQKAKDVVGQIIAQAMEEVGYKPPEFAMDMQIMMMPEKGLVLTLSEKMPDELANNPTLVEYLREMRKVLEQKFGLPAEQGSLPGTEGQSAPGQPAVSAVTKAGLPTPEDVTNEQVPNFAVFRFETLRDIYDYIKVLPKTLRVESRLYVEKKAYYLYMNKGGASYKRYSRACILALEYGSLYSASEDALRYLGEHVECLIAEKAIHKLRM